MTTNIWVLILLYAALSYPAVMATSKWIEHMRKRVDEKYGIYYSFSYYCRTLRGAYLLNTLVFTGWIVAVPVAIGIVLIKYLKMGKQLENYC